MQARLTFAPIRPGQSATLATKQQVDGSDANNLTVQLNETSIGMVSGLDTGAPFWRSPVLTLIWPATP